MCYKVYSIIIKGKEGRKPKGKNMRITMKAMNENEMFWIEKGLKSLGFTKISDCMWAKVYTNGKSEYVVTREF